MEPRGVLAAFCSTALRVCVEKKHRAQGINSLGLQGFTKFEHYHRINASFLPNCCILAVTAGRASVDQKFLYHLYIH